MALYLLDNFQPFMVAVVPAVIWTAFAVVFLRRYLQSKHPATLAYLLAAVFISINFFVVAGRLIFWPALTAPWDVVIIVLCISYSVGGTTVGREPPAPASSTPGSAFPPAVSGTTATHVVTA